jgi:Protein kinase domain
MFSHYRKVHRNTKPVVRSTASAGNESELSQVDTQLPTVARQHQQNLPLNVDSCDILGRPHDPIPFDVAQFDNGCRCNVQCSIPSYGTRELTNVLRRVSDNPYTRHVAYYPLPFKTPTETKFGHVFICQILESVDEGDDSSMGEYDDESNDSASHEPVYEWTAEQVVLKVSSIQKIQEKLQKHKKGYRGENPLDEISLLQLLKYTQSYHPNVLRCIAVIRDDVNYNLILPYYASGELSQLLFDAHQLYDKNNPNSRMCLSEGKARYWFRQILSGIHYMHKVLGVCHR